MTDATGYEDEETEVVDEADSLRRLIRDEIEAVLQSIPGEGSVVDVKKELPDQDEPLTLRAMEETVRRVVEDAMEPLRAAQKKPRPKAPRREPEPEPEPAPIEVKDARKRLSTFLWGAE